MNILLILAFLFSVGSLIGWLLELVFRRIVSKKWVNPGYLVGPCLPIYGFSLCVLYVLTMLEKYIPIENKMAQKAVLFFIMAICITAIEYLAGLIFIKKMKIKLWDYSDMRGNLQGIICPLFSFFWIILSAVYYFFIHPEILDMLEWLSHNLAFSFCIGLYFGIMIMDLSYSAQILYHIKQYAEEQQIIVRLEEFKEHIQEYRRKQNERVSFLFPFKTSAPLKDYFERYMNSPKVQKRIDGIKKLIYK